MKRQRTRAVIVPAALLGALALTLSGCEKQADTAEEGKDRETVQETVQEPEAGRLDKCDDLTDSEYLLTIDGYGVTEEEFLMFLRDQKAVTANYYYVNYDMQPDGEFWGTEVDGQTPLDYAKERALASVIEAKAEFILADEAEILNYKDYDDMMSDMEAENEERAEKKEKGEAVYGVIEYTPFTYYQYLNGNARAELEKHQIEVTDPTETELKEVYEANKDTFWLGATYSYAVHYEDGTEETVEQNTREIGKEESTKEDLIYNYFPTMKPGDIIKDYTYQGRPADIEFLSAEDLGYASFEESETSLRAFYARNEVNIMIAEKAKNAAVRVNKERYSRLEMP